MYRQVPSMYLLLLSAAQLCRAGSNCPLSQTVPRFEFRHETRIEALVRFARENEISLGLESLAGGSSPSVPQGDFESTAEATIRQLVGKAQPYRLFCVGNTVVVRSALVPGPAWLDRKLTRFQIPRMPMSLASASLSMQVKLLLDPNYGGFIGSVPSNGPADQVGPFDRRNATIRSLLCLLAGSEKGTVWITADGLGGQSLGTAVLGGPWTLALAPPAHQ